MTTSAVKAALSAAALAVLALPPGTPAAAAPKVWVSNTGSNANPCSLALPCATFQKGHDTADAGGEVGVINPGDYGAINISKSVSITNDGVGEAAIQVNAVNAILVSTGHGDVVGLRGLTIDGLGSATEGISADTVGALHIENCVVKNFEGVNGTGLFMFPVSGTNKLFISDSLFYNNGNGPNSGGIRLLAQGGSVDLVLDRVQLENNTFGLDIFVSASGGSIRATVRDSAAVGNVNDGIKVQVGSGGLAATALIERTTLVNNVGAGIRSSGLHAVVLLSDSSLTNNGSGIVASFGGQLISYGNNRNNNNIGAEGVATSLFGAF